MIKEKRAGISAIISANVIFGLNIPVTKSLIAQWITVSVFMNLQPIVASIVAIVVGQDLFTWDKPLAALLVLAGVYLVTTKR